ncbi:unnamed protein product [Brassica rapa subsp. trilocularis]
MSVLRTVNNALAPSPEPFISLGSWVVLHHHITSISFPFLFLIFEAWMGSDT